MVPVKSFRQKCVYKIVCKRILDRFSMVKCYFVVYRDEFKTGELNLLKKKIENYFFLNLE